MRSDEVLKLIVVYFITTGKTNTTKIPDVKLNEFVRKGLGEKTNRYKSIDELSDAYKNL